MFVEIVKCKTASQFQVITAALRSHGFTPLEGGDGGFPGVPRFTGEGGYPVMVPDDEERDAKMLAEALLADMAGPE